MTLSSILRPAKRYTAEAHADSMAKANELRAIADARPEWLNTPNVDLRCDR
jgi:hypothetical protein